jgi:hypothetical protein
MSDIGSEDDEQARKLFEDGKKNDENSRSE